MDLKDIILIIASHPDDEILGCGSTIHKLSKDNHDIHLLILGEGITSRQNNRNPNQVKKSLYNLKNEVKKSSKIVGIKSIELNNFPDNRFDSIPLLDIVKVIEKKKNAIKPSIIFTHHENDLNIDHRITFQAVMAACRPLDIETVKEIYSFEVLSSTEWQYQNQNNIFTPQYYVPISKIDLNAKIKAMQVYTSEKRKYPHPRSPEAIEILARWRGINIGVEFAEAFEVIRRIEQ